jgi:molecular chaperone GrpE
MSTHENPPQASAPEAPATAPEAAARTDDVMATAAARIAALEAELAEMKDRWMRAEAETQNVRHRARREVDEARQFAIQGFARDVAEAAENLRRGLDAMPAAGGNDIVDRLREGFQGVERSFLGLLERNGIKGEDPTGATFDPNLHQAMAEQESAEHPPGTILQAWTQAWTLNGRLLRPAMVVVAKAPAEALPGAAPGQKLDTTA